jgi:hypothetical protein
MSAKTDVGMDVWLDKVPMRQPDMKGWELLLSESQERMLVIIEKGREKEVEKVLEKWDLTYSHIGMVTDTKHVRYFMGDVLEADIPAESLVLGGGAPVYRRTWTEPEYMKEIAKFDLNSVVDLSLAEAKDAAIKLCNEPNIDQPSQKGFETALWNALRKLDPSQPVFVESESKKVGGLHIPDALMEKIRNGACIELRSNTKTRVSWLIREYHHFLTGTDNFKDKLALLTTHYGKVQIAKWNEAIDAGNFPELVEELLVKHYDPSYQSSIVRNFPQYRIEHFVALENDSNEAFTKAAKAIVAKLGSS